MNKPLFHNALIKRIAKQTGLFEYQVRLTIKYLIKNIVLELSEGNSVKVHSLGTFRTGKARRKKFYSLQEKKMMTYPQRLVPKFKWTREPLDKIKQGIKEAAERDSD